MLKLIDKLRLLCCHVKRAARSIRYNDRWSSFAIIQYLFLSDTLSITNRIEKNYGGDARPVHYKTEKNSSGISKQQFNLPFNWETTRQPPPGMLVILHRNIKTVSTHCHVRSEQKIRNGIKTPLYSNSIKNRLVFRKPRETRSVGIGDWSAMEYLASGE